MNSEIAKQRLSEVIRIDTITSSYGDFLATHVPFKKIQLQKQYSTGDMLNKYYTEDEVYRSTVLNPKDEHQFSVIIGSSGAGKSHLIRWFAAKLEKEKPENEVILFIRRSDNTLKGTIKQLLDMKEVSSIPNKEIYKRLVNATSSISEDKLKDTIYHSFLVEIGADEYIDGIDNLSNVDRKRIIPLLNNELFKERMMSYDGPIERIYSKVAKSSKKDNRDVVPKFTADDFRVDISFCDKVEREGGDRKAQKMLDKLIVDPDLPEAVAQYLNTLVEPVIQNCAGLEPGDFEQVFKEIRKELKRQGKKLTLLIEDITSFTGVNEALLSALSIPHTGDYEKENMCRISSFIGITSEYYMKDFRDNYKHRVTKFIVIPDDAFGNDENNLCEFVGRYLNTMSLDKDTIDYWVRNGADSKDYPVHKVMQGDGWDTIEISNGKKLNLFPFTKNAIIYMYNNILQENYRTPRCFLRDVVEKTVRDALWNFENFPGFKIKNTKTNYELRERLRALNLSNDLFDRMYLFMCIWGDGSINEYANNNVKYISNLSIKVYKDMGFPLINGKLINTTISDQTQSNEIINNGITKTPSEIAAEKKLKDDKNQLNENFQQIESWVLGDTLNLGATTKNVVLITKAREDMCNYLYSAIDWQAEGVSMDNIDKIKKVKDKLIGFERQKRGLDAMFYKLPANRETQNVLEAFMEWNVLGKRSWNFEGADRRVYSVQVWTEKIKKPLIKAITTFEKRDIDYFKCAMINEYYRIILLGISKVTTIDGLKPEQIIDSEIRGIGVNSHADSWNSLLEIITRGESDKINRSTVIQYCNVIQGESHAQVFLDRNKFDAMVREVKNDKLHVDPSVLEIYDPVKPRRDARDLLKNILIRIEKVREDELSKAKTKIDTIVDSFGTSDIDDEDIENLIDTIEEFYKMAEESKLPIIYDQALFSEVKRDSRSTSFAIQDIIKAQNAKNVIDCIMLFSQDPIRKVEKLYQLLKKVYSDIEKVKSENIVRKSKLGGCGESSEKNEVFKDEKILLEECKANIEKWEDKLC